MWKKRRVACGGVRLAKKGPRCGRDRARGGGGRAPRERGESTESARRGSRTRLARLRARANHPGLATRAAIAEPRRVASWNRRPLRPTEVRPKSLERAVHTGAMLSWPSTLSTGTAPRARERPMDSIDELAIDRVSDRRARARVRPRPYPAFGRAHPRGRGAKAKTKRRRALRSRPCAYLERVMEAAIARGASIVRVTRVPGVVTAHGEVTARGRLRAARTNLPVHTPRRESK